MSDTPILDLPIEALQKIAFYLHQPLQLIVLDREPNSEETAETLARRACLLLLPRASGDRLKLGFSKGQQAIRQVIFKKIQQKSALHDYLLDRFPYPTTTFILSDDPLLYWLSQMVKPHKGETCHPASSIIAFTKVCRAFYAATRQHPNRETNTDWLAFTALKQHLAYGRQQQAIEILKQRPHLQLSKYRDNITTCSEAQTYHQVTALQFLYLEGDWHLMRALIAGIPTDEAAYYRENLRHQLTELAQQPPLLTTDLLLLRGVQRFNRSPTIEEQSFITRRHGFLIFFYENSQTQQFEFGIGYAKTNADGVAEYQQHTLSTNHPLSQFVLQEKNMDLIAGNFNFKIIRQRYHLKLYAATLAEQQISHTITAPATAKDLTEITNLLQDYCTQFYQRSQEQRILQWCVVVGGEQRLLPALFWQILYSNKHSDLIRTKAKDRRPTPRTDNRGRLWAPLSSDLGDCYAVFRSRFDRAQCDWSRWENDHLNFLDFSAPLTDWKRLCEFKLILEAQRKSIAILLSTPPERELASGNEVSVPTKRCAIM